MIEGALVSEISYSQCAVPLMKHQSTNLITVA